MARHLILGNGAAWGVTDGLVDDGALSIQKMSAKGPTELVLGDTPINAPQIRIVGGGSDGKNIETPWFYGRDVLNYSGQSYTAQVAQSSTVQFTSAATNTTDIVTTIKFINTTNGNEPFNMKSFNVTTNASALNTVAEIGEAFVDEMYTAYASGGGAVTTTQSDQLPDFVKTIAWDNTDLLTFVGWTKGETDRQGNVVEHPTTFKIVTENLDFAAQGGVAAVVYGTAALRGSGDANYVKEFEENVMGTQYGYYNRIHLPNTPTTQADTTTPINYDLYNIVASKDGSSSSQIHGVDNLIEISVGAKAGDADSLVFENKLNGYFAGVFPNVIL